MAEKWRRIATHPRYEVSNRGRIRNTKTGHVLSNTKTGNGYLKVNLGTGPKCTQRVNRLVAFAFLGDVALSGDVASVLSDALRVVLNTGRRPPPGSPLLFPLPTPLLLPFFLSSAEGHGLTLILDIALSFSNLFRAMWSHG